MTNSPHTFFDFETYFHILPYLCWCTFLVLIQACIKCLFSVMTSKNVITNPYDLEKMIVKNNDRQFPVEFNIIKNVNKI